MQKRIATLTTLAIGLLTILAPILAALYLAHRQGAEQESARASVMAGELLHRTDEMGAQATDAYRRLRQAAPADPCSQHELALMREISMESSYLRAVGHVRGGRLLCSSLGNHGAGLALGPVAYTSTLGARVRPSVTLGPGVEGSFLMFEKAGVMAAIHPDTLLDVFVDRTDLAFGIYGASSGLPLGVHHEFDPAWVARLGQADATTFFDGRFLVAIRRSSKYDIAAYVAVPAAYLRGHQRDLMLVLLPLGLLLGLGLLLTVMFLARQQNSMPTALRLALKRKEFVLHYQPIVALASGAMVGAEALLRWPRRHGPEARPALFVPVAEDCGLIGQFTEYVLARVAAEAPAFIARHPDSYISINLSPADLHDESIVEALAALAGTAGLDARNLMVELTEHSCIDAERASAIVNRIRALGIRVAIDDFGTGFSSLSHLTTFRTDCLKIDKVFVETVGTDAVTSEVALHIISIARALGLTLIGEGIETPEQAAFLRGHGVEYGQGWLYGKARPMAALLGDAVSGGGKQGQAQGQGQGQESGST